MTLRQLADAARAEAFLLVAGALVGLLVGLAVALGMPKDYRATATLYVAAEAVDTNGAYRGGQLAGQEAQSYAGIVSSSQVAASVQRKLGIDRPVDAIGEQLVGTVSPDSTVLRVTASDTDPVTAAALANAAAEGLVRVVSGLEAPDTPGALPQVGVRIVQPASAPATPVAPVPAVDLLVGLAVGLAAGIAAAALRRTIATAVTSVEELGEVVGSPVLGDVPRDAVRGRAAGAGPGGDPFEGGTPEAFRTLRAQLRFLGVDRPREVLLVTSALAQEGKSTTVIGTARALADAGTSVCVVEADLRRPAAAGRLGVDGAVGLTSVLRGDIPLTDAVVTPHDALPLDVLPAGPLPPNPAELLGSERLRQVLAALRACYDVVLVDGAPALPVDDALPLAAAVDGVVLVCRAGTTTREQLGATAAAVAMVGGEVVGTVLTFAAPRRDAGYRAYRADTAEGAGQDAVPAGAVGIAPRAARSAE